MSAEPSDVDGVVIAIEPHSTHIMHLTTATITIITNFVRNMFGEDSTHRGTA